MYWNNNNVNNNAQPQTKSDEEILDKEREAMDRFQDKNWYANGNKLRKKLKRWFDRCRKRKLGDNSVKAGECCYKIERPANVIYMGKKASTNANHEFQLPYLIIDEEGYILHYQKESGSQQEESKRLSQMSYDEFYKLYRKAVGYCGPREFFLDVYDGFMSWTQVPRQLKTKKGVKAESVGGHVANIATRVFSPVIAAGIGLCAGAVAAYKGAKVLKKKLIPTKQELMAMKENCAQDLYYKYAKTTNKVLNNLQEGLIDNWKSGKMPGMHYNDIKRTLDSNQKIYGNPPKQDLNTINNQNLPQNTQNVN